MPTPVRVLVAKPGLDGHDRGAKVVAAALRDAGMEVMYTGLHVTPVQIAEAAMQEDVNIVGLSILSGAHLSLTRKVDQSLREHGIRAQVGLMVGGAIPPLDVAKLQAAGADGVFPTGTPLAEIVAWIQARRR